MDDEKDDELDEALEKTNDFFGEHGLELEYNKVEIGKKYPIYGMITAIISEDPFKVQINYNIEATLLLSNDPEKISIIKDRILEPGIFVTEINNVIDNENEYKVFGTVTVVVFGKKQHTEFDA